MIRRREDPRDYQPRASSSDGGAQTSGANPGPGGGLGGALLQRKIANRLLQRKTGDAPDGGGQAPAQPAAHATLRMGSRGPEVTQLQQLLNQHGNSLVPDGDFGGKTATAVKAFQKSAGLAADGVVGPATWQALEGGGASKPAGPDAGAGTPGGGPGTPGGGAPVTDDKKDGDKKPGDGAASGGSRRTLKKGMIGDDVRTMQEQVAAAGITIWVDGSFGDGTAKAVRAFQTKAGLEPTGIVDADTWAALDRVAPLVSGPATRQPRSPALQKLIDGGYSSAGKYKPSQDGFTDPELDVLLKEYGKYWLVDTSLAPGSGEQKDNSQAGGHSAGKSVLEHPPWVGVMQQKLIAKTKWTDDEAATNKLLEAFLVGWTSDKPGGMASNVEEFYRHTGKSETNKQAGPLGGAKGNDNWCAAASSSATVLGLLRKGVRFSTGGPPSKMLPAELQKQTNRLVEWENKRPGNTVGGTAAWTAQLSPGDIMSIVGSGPLSGHVATVIEDTGDAIKMVSGNAAGATGNEGSVRVEQVRRERPPDSYNYLQIAMNSNAYAGAKATVNKLAANPDMTPEEAAKFEAAEAKMQQIEAGDLPTSRQDSRFKPGKHAPAQPGVVWVVSYYKTSKLNANVLTQDLSGESLSREGLERCEPLESAYPDHAKYGI